MWNPFKTNKLAENELETKKAPKLIRRKFEAGQNHKTLNQWLQTSYDLFDKEIQTDLVNLRSRSRDASINDVYARRYFQALSNSVIGPKGIVPRFNIAYPNGNLDTVANDILSKAFDGWAKDCTVDGLSFKDAQKLFIETTARDGECLVQMLRGKGYGKSNFKLRFIEAEYLDVQFNKILNNGNIVRSAIEYDPIGSIIAYHIFKYHPKDQDAQSIRNQERIRIPKAEIIHGFKKERAGQGRGFPWLSPALINLTHLKEYQKSELVAARVASAKMGFFTKTSGENDDQLGDEYTDTDLLQEAEPGTFDILPEGYSLSTFDPDNPNGNFQNFVKVILRGIAASLGVAYHTLSNDLESTSYSSLRQGEMDQRDNFKDLQQFVINNFIDPIFLGWLEMILLSDQVRLPIESFDKFNNVEWIPRHFNYIDVSKETVAVKTGIEQKIKSRTEAVRERGREFKDVVSEIKAENQLMKDAGITGEQVDAALANTDILTNKPNKKEKAA